MIARVLWRLLLRALGPGAVLSEEDYRGLLAAIREEGDAQQQKGLA